MIQIGDILFLDIHKPGQAPLKYKCKVEHVGEQKILITYPTNLRTNKSEFFMVGTEFHGHFTSKDKNTYSFKTEMVDRKKDRIPLLVMSFPGEKNLRKIQRREFVRVDSSIDVAIHPKDIHFTPFTTMTSDISAGGCAITLPERHALKAGMVVYCWMVLPMKDRIHYIKQKASVIRIIEGENGKRDKAPLQFIEVSEKEKQNYLRFCFEEQLRFKKNGLL